MWVHRVSNGLHIDEGDGLVVVGKGVEGGQGHVLPLYGLGGVEETVDVVGGALETLTHHLATLTVHAEGSKYGTYTMLYKQLLCILA